MWLPKMWIGKPSAEASSRLSPVQIEQLKSRALLMTPERAARSKGVRHFANDAVDAVGDDRGHVGIEIGRLMLPNDVPPSQASMLGGVSSR